MKTKFIFILLTFCAAIAQGLWINWLDNEGILVVDIPLLLLFIFGRKRLTQAPFNQFSLAMVAVFYLWTHLGVFFAPNQLMFRQEAVSNLRVFLIFYAILSFINSKNDLQNVFLGFAIGLAFQSAVGIHQWLRGPVGIRFLGEKLVSNWQSQGTFVHPSVFAIYVALITILTYRMAVFVKPKNYQFYFIVFIAGCVALYSSSNRANWLAFAASMVFGFAIDMKRGQAFNPRVRNILFLSLIIAVIGMIRYGDNIIGRFTGAEESLYSERSSSRKSLALDAFRIMNEHPIVGTGLNNYHEYVSDLTAGTKIVHCSYLLIAAETGYPGLIIFIVLIGSFMAAQIKGMNSRDPFLRHVAQALFTATLSFAIAILPSPDYRIVFVKSHIWMIWALSLAVIKLDFHMNRLNRMKVMAKQPVIPQDRFRSAASTAVAQTFLAKGSI